MMPSRPVTRGMILAALLALGACSDASCPPGRTKVANNRMRIAADAAADSSVSDAVIIACDADKPCTRADLSLSVHAL
jgi:hypothetical protein